MQEIPTRDSSLHCWEMAPEIPGSFILSASAPQNERKHFYCLPCNKTYIPVLFPRPAPSITPSAGKVSKVSDLDVRWTSLDPNYGIAHLDGVIGETGKLEILKVVPISGSGPYFIARWDQGREHLDIDMHGASRTAIKKFKSRTDGYSGHHTCRSTDPDKRVFDVKIQIPTGIIFEGTVSFSNTYDVRLRMQSSSKLTVDMSVIRAKQKS